MYKLDISPSFVKLKLSNTLLRDVLLNQLMFSFEVLFAHMCAQVKKYENVARVHGRTCSSWTSRNFPGRPRRQCATRTRGDDDVSKVGRRTSRPTMSARALFLFFERRVHF